MKETPVNLSETYVKGFIAIYKTDVHVIGVAWGCPVTETSIELELGFQLFQVIVVDDILEFVYELLFKRHNLSFQFNLRGSGESNPKRLSYGRNGLQHKKTFKEAAIHRVLIFTLFGVILFLFVFVFQSHPMQSRF